MFSISLFYCLEKNFFVALQIIFNFILKMSYIEFDKTELVNIPFSKKKEIVRCSRTGAFASTTLLGLNTRKYHGLFILPQENVDGERHVLVSTLNESIIIDDMEFHLGMHQYKGGIFDPKGNKYLQKFNADIIPVYHFRVGHFNFTKEILFSDTEERLIIKYTILDDFESASFQFQPLLAFRQIHHLTHKNDQANTGYEVVQNGVKYCLYDKYTPIYLQSSEAIDYQHAPDWFYNIEYDEEIKRGYDGHEDLLKLGRINVPVKSKELYFTIGTSPIDPKEIANIFNSTLDGHRYSNNCTDRPWMVGETALPADNDSVSYEYQRQFLLQSYTLARQYHAAGYGWWEYHECPDGVNFEAQFTGLVNQNNEDKPAVLELPILKDKTIPTDNHQVPSNYYNMLGYNNIVLKGRVVDSKSGQGVKDALVRGWTKDWIGMNTYTDENGNFTLYSNDFNVHFEISAPGMNTIKFDRHNIKYHIVDAEAEKKWTFENLPDQYLEYQSIDYKPFLETDSLTLNFNPKFFNQYMIEGEMGEVRISKLAHGR